MAEKGEDAPRVEGFEVSMLNDSVTHKAPPTGLGVHGLAFPAKVTFVYCFIPAIASMARDESY